VCVIAALGIVVATRRANQNVNVSTVTTVPRIGPTTSPPRPSTTAPSRTTTTGLKIVPAGTQEIQYQPFTANGIDPKLHVTQRLTGTCIRTQEGSRNYYRCFANPSSGIYDPCFAGPHGTAEPLVCPTNPETPDVVELTATSVTSDPPTTVTRPWAMQLGSGRVCLFVSAAWGGLGPYSCVTGGIAQPVADCHEPASAQPWWTAACQKQLTDASPFTSSRVVKLWY
jgi:hypothetical protein